ncbi:MAG: thioesterase family protein [Verrucomicrobia bacterium]|nr:thioesterase family protein [Verrucomicrobiota bacterium]
MSTTHIFEHHLRVVASDCTVGNHVYYSRYLDWLEAARNELMRAIGHPFPALMESGIMLPAIEAQLHYRGAARFDDRVLVRLWIAEVSRIKITFAADIVNADTGKTLVSATTTHVCTDRADKPHRLPPTLLQSLESRVRTELA